MLKNLKYCKRKMQVEILLKITKIFCTVCIALILFPLAAVNLKSIYTDVSECFLQLKEKLQAEKLPWQ